MSDERLDHRATVLRARARRLAQPIERARTQAGDLEVALVRIGGQPMGIPVERLREIVPSPPLAKLPGVPSWVLGLTHHRGELLTVIDTAQWFELAAHAARSTHYLALLSAQQVTLGLRCDAVLGFDAVPRAALSLPASGPHADCADAPVLGITRDLVTIIDVDAVFERAHLAGDAGAHDMETA